MLLTETFSFQRGRNLSKKAHFHRAAVPVSIWVAPVTSEPILGNLGESSSRARSSGRVRDYCGVGVAFADA
jgi:hypothetical protein